MVLILLSIAYFNFNSRTSCEVRRTSVFGSGTALQFQLTHLLRGATCSHGVWGCAGAFQLTHLLRGATESTAEGRTGSGFQLTHLLRGATLIFDAFIPAKLNFNSRTSCEVRHNAAAGTDLTAAISTHAPLARCDIFPFSSFTSTHLFQLTHLLRGATCAGSCLANAIRYFNSRTSCEVRLQHFSGRFPVTQFQLTHLLRGATPQRSFRRSCSAAFQLTHLLRGATILPAQKHRTVHHFNSRTSCEVRQRG